jgi:hypothetical protein
MIKAFSNILLFVFVDVLVINAELIEPILLGFLLGVAQ